VDFADILRQKTARRLDVTIVLREGLDDEGQKTEDVAVITFEAIGRPAYETLLSQHQPAPEVQVEHRQKQLQAGVRPGQTTELRWDQKTFPPALIAACAVAPPITLEQARALWDDEAWNPFELDKLFSGALIVNQTDAGIRLGKGYEAIVRSKQN
jgi:hypothetical protein